MAKTRPITTDAGEILFRRFYEGKPERIRQLEEERLNDDVSRKIYDLRTHAGLTQQELAALIGTTASVISRIEDYEYDGHSMNMLRRVAAALETRLSVDFARSQPDWRMSARASKLSLKVKVQTGGRIAEWNVFVPCFGGVAFHKPQLAGVENEKSALAA
ncbi:XRE family transcriptional regulator [Candidatus Sumerlaeota bacterium]|nr:XRE family transcriptional regulator [Candidatus Sumerlaeota bacterium]MBI3736149.1 XRE family transcriptional regulator [Candidatus Sumerlaeota bacterium]